MSGEARRASTRPHGHRGAADRRPGSRPPSGRESSARLGFELRSQAVSAVRPEGLGGGRAFQSGTGGRQESPQPRDARRAGAAGRTWGYVFARIHVFAGSWLRSPRKAKTGPRPAGDPESPRPRPSLRPGAGGVAWPFPSNRRGLGWSCQAHPRRDGDGLLRPPPRRSPHARPHGPVTRCPASGQGTSAQGQEARPRQTSGEALRVTKAFSANLRVPRGQPAASHVL